MITINIKFPEYCELHKPTQLDIELIFDSSPSLNATLIFSITADEFDIDHQWQSMGIEPEKNSYQVDFNLTAQTTGPQIIEIEILHTTTRVGYFVINTQVNEIN